MTIDDLAKLLAKGFRGMRKELRDQRENIAQTRVAVVEYSRSVEDRDKLRLEQIDALRHDVNELKRRGMQ